MARTGLPLKNAGSTGIPVGLPDRSLQGGMGMEKSRRVPSLKKSTISWGILLRSSTSGLLFLPITSTPRRIKNNSNSVDMAVKITEAATVVPNRCVPRKPCMANSPLSDTTGIKTIGIAEAAQTGCAKRKA